MDDEVKQELNLTVVLKSMPVHFIRDGGEKVTYTLREMTGEQRDAFFNSTSKVLDYREGKPVGLKNYRGFQSALLSKCLYDEHGELVTTEILAKFPTTALNAMWVAAHELSGLDRDSEKAIKNG